MTLSAIHSGAFPATVLSSQPDHTRTPNQGLAPALSPKPGARDGDGASTPAEQRQAALQLVTNRLTQAYDKLANRGVPSAAEAYNDQEPMTATKAATTILGFIERRLQMDAAEGANSEQLKARLEAGLEGFKKGFAEAAEQLKALSMLSPEVEADIGDTYKQVLSGLDALRAHFIQAAAPKAGDTELKSAPAAALKPPSQVNNIAAQQGLYEYAEARDFRFEVRTQEGDKISIRASSSLGVSAASASYGNSRHVQASSSSASSFSLAIEGDLSEDELSAINDLLARVDHLAGQFYAGNLDQAFDKALALGYDEQQIAGYSLNLAQVQIHQAAVAYGAFTPAADAAPSLAAQLEPVGNFIKDVLESLGLASGFLEPHKLLLGLSQQMADKAAGEAPAPTALSQFLERILATDLDAFTARPERGALTDLTDVPASTARNTAANTAAANPATF